MKVPTFDREKFLEDSVMNGIPVTVAAKIADLTEIRIALVSGATMDRTGTHGAGLRAQYIDTLCAVSLELARQAFATANIAMLCLPDESKDKFRGDWIKAIGAQKKEPQRIVRATSLSN